MSETDEPRPPTADGEPAAMDAWLRTMLGRPLRLAGLTLAVEIKGPRGPAECGEPPHELLDVLARYRELWVRWAAAGEDARAPLARAAREDADAVLIWLVARVGAASGAPPAGATPALGATLEALRDEADALGLRDRAALALAGPWGSRQLARRLGYDEGFDAAAEPHEIAAALAREAAAREALRRGGSSPPCYL